MIIDTSAVVAILKAEPGWETIDQLITCAIDPRMSAGTYLELGIVASRHGDPAVERRVDQLLDRWGVRIEPFTAAHAATARAAYRDFGRGSGHPARLNFGDCFAYALSSESGEPLMFVGDDFTYTDLAAAQ